MLHSGRQTVFQADPESRKETGAAMLQQLAKSITGLIFLVAAAGAFAQAPKTPLALKADAPDRYVVVPGDTLWSIAERFTDSPWRWPELWNLNKEAIKNPHRIYPGNVIVLDRARAQLAISGEPGTVKLSPRVRAESLEKLAIPSIPPSAIEPFLVRPLVVEPDGLEKAPTIVGTEGGRVILAAGHEAYVRGIAGSKEQDWFVYRGGGALVDPDTNQTVGHEAVYLGSARVTRAGDPATVVLTSVTQEVVAGDKLVAAGRAQPINYAPHAPTTQVAGRVISVYGASKVAEAGRHSIIAINRGRADGIEIGHVLALYSRGGTARDMSRAKDDPQATIALPDERAGLAFVFRVFERVSYALVMHVTRPINPLDAVRTP
jgi:hypothetical protein